MNLVGILRASALSMVVGGVALGAGCAAPPDEEAPGTAELAVTNVPASVACIRVTATANIIVERYFDVSPGQSTVFQVAGLPVGSVAFLGEAFSTSCAGVTPLSGADWISDPVVAYVTASPPASVLLAMHRNGKAQVGVDFPDDPSCGLAGAPCQISTDCCSGSCSAGFCASTQGQQCVSDADCPPSLSECQASVCLAGACAASYLPAGAPVSAQQPGDCRVNVCDGMGGVMIVPDDSDAPPSGNQCMNNICAGGVPLPNIAPDGAPCNQNGGAYCFAGTCVQCSFDAQCGGGGVCVNNMCQASCIDAIRDGSETDIDCGGGACPACADGKACGAGSDCTSLVCVAGICQPPTCTDGIRNGTETCVDCGGGCGPCPVGCACMVSVDCMSGMCVNNMCF